MAPPSSRVPRRLSQVKSCREALIEMDPVPHQSSPRASANAEGEQGHTVSR